MREGKKKAYFLAALVFAALLLLGGGSLWAQETGQVRFRDMAKLLTVGEEAKLMTRAREIVQRTGYDLMLVTTQDAGGKSARDYAEDYYFQKSITAMDTQLSELKLANDSEYNRVISSVDLEHLKDVAMNELGMVYAGESQIKIYDSTESDYVKQYQDIPAE